MSTYNLLSNINGAIKNRVRLHRTLRGRHADADRNAGDEVAAAAATSRLLFIEALRNLGFGARFVTGYLYDPALDGGSAMQGVGSTHAWADVYLPGAGWVEYDPTNGLIAGENLIRVAVTAIRRRRFRFRDRSTARTRIFWGFRST